MGAIFARPRLPPFLQDVLLAALVAYFQVNGTRLVGTGDPAAELAEPYRVGYLLLIGSGLALLARRRFPAATFLTLAGASVVYYVAGYPDDPAG